jgi:hypothetical protein
MERAETLGEAVGVSKACQALGVPRSRLYRERAVRQETEQVITAR